MDRTWEALGRKSRVVHGYAKVGPKLPEYGIWLTMRSRCNNPKFYAYARYGGRGIKVCERWASFANFLADMGTRPSNNHQIDRIDNNGNYEPGNCRWATRKENCRNRRSNVVVEIDGVSKTAEEWSEQFGVSAWAICWRVKHGWEPKKAVSQPVRDRTKKKNSTP